MKDVILFSQAPADIQYIIYLYDKYKDCNVTIIVVNVINNYKYLKSLSLNAEISFIPLISQRHFLKFLLYPIKLQLIYFKQFIGLKDASIYFFSNNYDYVTAFFIQKLNYKNNVYFYDLYDLDGPPLKGINSLIKVALTRLLFGITVKFFKLSSYVAYQYIFENTDVKHITLNVNINRLNHYRYYTKKTKNIKVLLFESNEMRDDSFVEYGKHITAILDKLPSDCNIYIKPHPRLGYSSILNGYNIKLVPDFVPSELLYLDDFTLVLGIGSTSIATAIHSNKYSLIYLFDFRDEKRREYLVNYLNKLSGNRLVYLNNLADLYLEKI